MKNKKAIILSVIAIITLLVLIIGATYAYFQASGGTGTSANLRVTTYTTDIITFEVGSNINIETNATLFSQGKGNASGTTFARATLTANNKTNSATENYNLFLNISDNTFAYSVDTNTPELILTIKDKSNNEVTSIEGLTYKTVTDGKGTTIKGFDITNKNGLLTLFNKDITTTSTTVEEWNVTVTFVNYNKDQTGNAGKKFDAQLIISKDDFSDYTPNTINTLSASKSGNNLTVNLNLENGSNPIDKYYYAIEETNGLAILDSKASVKRLSNRLAVSELTYVESNNSSYTFTNIKTDANYNVYAYAVDNKKVKTNTYNYKYTSNYNLPVISKVETSKTSNSITATVTATKGTNNISKYYYSIDNGNTFTESTSNSYTFNNLSNNTNYRIVVKVMDTNGKYSNTYIMSEKIENSSNLITFTFEDTSYKAENGMTWEEWIDSEYNTWRYPTNGFYNTNKYKVLKDGDVIKFYPDTTDPLRINIKTEGVSLYNFTEKNFKNMPNHSSATDEALTKIKSLYKKDLSAFSDFQNITDEYILSNREELAEKLQGRKVFEYPYIFKVTDSSIINANSNSEYDVLLSVPLMQEDTGGWAVLSYNPSTDLFCLVDPNSINEQAKTINISLEDNVIFALLIDEVY